MFRFIHPWENELIDIIHSTLGQGEESTQSVCIALRTPEPDSRPRKLLVCLLCSVASMIGTLTSELPKKP